jgi:hypothetical protein
MAGLLSLLRKTLRKGTRAVRFVGKKTTNVMKKGTNAVGLTKRRRGPGKSLKNKSRKNKTLKNKGRK